MARIQTYVSDAAITANDKWIGSDGDNQFQTKNFTPAGLASYFNESGTIKLSNALKFKYTDATRTAGGFNFNSALSGAQNFSDITELVFSKESLSTDVEAFLNITLNCRILLQEMNDPNTFGVYDVTAIEEHPLDAEYLIFTLDHKSSNGTTTSGALYFLSIIDFAGSVDKHFVHTQSVATSTWPITHNLEKYPSVTVVDFQDRVIVGNIQYTSNNELTLTFSSAFSGKAYLN